MKLARRQLLQHKKKMRIETFSTNTISEVPTIHPDIGRTCYENFKSEMIKFVDTERLAVPCASCLLSTPPNWFDIKHLVDHLTVFNVDGCLKLYPSSYDSQNCKIILCQCCKTSFTKKNFPF